MGEISPNEFAQFIGKEMVLAHDHRVEYALRASGWIELWRVLSTLNQDVTDCAGIFKVQRAELGQTLPNIELV